MQDNVNHPDHYLKGSLTFTVEPIEITSKVDFCTGNIIKYLMRAPYKGNTLEDLQKALFYAKYREEYLCPSRYGPIPDLIEEKLAESYPIIWEAIYGNKTKTISMIEDLINEYKSKQKKEK